MKALTDEQAFIDNRRVLESEKKNLEDFIKKNKKWNS